MGEYYILDDIKVKATHTHTHDILRSKEVIVLINSGVLSI